jgi:hypothetical protein
MFILIPMPAKADVSLQFDDDGASINIDEPRYYKMRKHCRKPWNYWENECRWLRKIDRDSHKKQRHYRRHHKHQGFSLDLDF